MKRQMRRRIGQCEEKLRRIVHERVAPARRDSWKLDAGARVLRPRARAVLSIFETSSDRDHDSQTINMVLLSMRRERHPSNKKGGKGHQSNRAPGAQAATRGLLARNPLGQAALLEHGRAGGHEKACERRDKPERERKRCTGVRV